MGAFASNPFTLLRPIENNVLQQAGQFAQLQALAQERQQRAQEMQIQQLKLQEVQRAQQEQQTLQAEFGRMASDPAYQTDGQLDLNKAAQGLYGKVRPSVIEGIQKTYLGNQDSIAKAQKDRAEAEKTLQEAQDKKLAAQVALRNGYGGVMEDWLNGNHDPNVIHARLTFDAQNPALSAQDKAQIEGWRNQWDSATPDQQKAIAQQWAGQMTSDYRNQRAEGTAKALANASARRSQAIQELAPLEVNPDGTFKDPDAYHKVAAKYQDVLPPNPDPGFVARLIRGQVAAKDPKDLADYDVKMRQADIVRNMTPESLNATIDRVVPPDGETAALNQRTKVQAQQALNRKDPLTAIDAIIKDASDQIGRTETALRTAKATAPIKIQVGAGLAAARAPKLSDDAEELAAVKLLNGEAIPGLLARNPITAARITERASQIAKENGMTAQQVVLEQHAAKANTQAYNKLNTMYATLKPFGEMAERNADRLEQLIAQNPDLGVTFLNTPIRDLATKFGSTRMAAFNAVLVPTRTEFARVLNSATGTGIINIPAMHEMQKTLPEDATVGQMRSALKEFRGEWANRKATMESDLADLKTKSVVGGPTGPNPGQGPQAMGGYRIGGVYPHKTGDKTYLGGDPTDPANWRQAK